MIKDIESVVDVLHWGIKKRELKIIQKKCNGKQDLVVLGRKRKNQRQSPFLHCDGFPV